MNGAKAECDRMRVLLFARIDTNMLHKLQKIIFPQGERLQMHWGLFYHGNYCVPVPDVNCGIIISSNQKTDFSSYMNGFPLNKWRLYTDIRSLRLELDAMGKFAVNLVGYSLEPNHPARHEYSSTVFDLKGREKITLDFPDIQNISHEFLAFEILTYSESVLYGGAFYGGYDESADRGVRLAIATTTFKKEEFIKRNVALIKKELLDSDDEIASHLFMHVVDNGRTLSAADINGKNIYLHPNKNTGGSGGFARGMIEAMHQNPEATHVLLMDDDVIVMPESIRRTYVLLTLLKDEWKDAFVSGAMLEMGAMFWQHEDIGMLNDEGYFTAAKQASDVRRLENILRVNMPVTSGKRNYAAWWYCCIPIGMVKKNGLPLPIFIRCDDIEYGIRSRTKFINMSGICLWHMMGKYNPPTDIYHTLRNVLIGRAIGSFDGVYIVSRIKKEFRRLVLEFAYSSAELVLLAVEDYMRGPEFLEKTNGEMLMKEYSALSEKMQMLEKFPEIEVVLHDVYLEPPRKKIRHLLYQLTYNGHRFFPQSRLNKKPAVIGYDWSYQPAKQAFRRQLLAVNGIDRTASLRDMDRKRFRELMRRYKKDMSRLKTHGAEIESKWREAKERLTSEAFWREYLGV